MSPLSHCCRNGGGDSLAVDLSEDADVSVVVVPILARVSLRLSLTTLSSCNQVSISEYLAMISKPKLLLLYLPHKYFHSHELRELHLQFHHWI